MRRCLPFFIVLLAFTSVACPPTPKDDPAKDKGGVKTDDKARPVVDVPKDLKPRVELALAQIQGRDLLTTNNFWTVFHGILGSGLDKTMLTDPKTKKKTNAIEYICAGGEIRGMQFLPTTHGLDVLTAKGFELQGVAQGHQDQFIAEMAQWGMPRDKKFKVGGKDFTFEDFTRHAKMRASTTKQQELSWAIIIIAQYYGSDHKWTNQYNEELRFEDVVKYEVDAPIDQAACGGTHRLFGMTWAYHLHRKNGGASTGAWKEVEAKIADYKKRARKLQKSDGSFPTDYFVGAAHADDPHLRIGAAGHIVEWLSLAMTDDELRSDWMQLAVSSLARMIVDMERAEVDGGALYHAAHGLHLYHTRVFGSPPDYLPLPPTR